MKYAILIAEDNRILSATFERFAANNHVIVDTLPDGNISNYLYVNGEYVYSPLPEEEPEVVTPIEERVSDLEEALNMILAGVTE